MIIGIYQDNIYKSTPKQDTNVSYYEFHSRKFPFGAVGLGSGVAMRCGVAHRYSSDLALLWPWCRPAATAPIGPLAWEPPYAKSAALKRPKKSLCCVLSSHGRGGKSAGSGAEHLGSNSACAM